MPTLFTVRWPLFARLEAVLFFPVTVALASETVPIRRYVDVNLFPAVKPFLSRSALPDSLNFWIAMALAVVVPYVIGMLVIDRLLTVRKGFAVLALVAVAGWVAAAMAFSDRLTSFVPSSLEFDDEWISVELVTALTIGGIALATHAWPIWIGARDRGDVAMRLVATREEAAFERNQRNGPDDARYQRTATRSDWRGREDTTGHYGPRESPVVKIIWALTWIGIIGGSGAVYLARNNTASMNKRPSVDMPAPGPASPGIASQAMPGLSTPGTPVVSPAPMPRVQTVGAVSVPNTQVAAAPPLPTVQRPRELSASSQTSNMTAGDNEAVAERGQNGHFAFDAIVNGTHVPMMFDTGATVVALRAEDAARLGIIVSRLNFSSKAKTANGIAEVAPIMIDTITVGNITQRHVPGFVGRPGALQENLLGQAFLGRLSGYNVERNHLILKGR